MVQSVITVMVSCSPYGKNICTKLHFMRSIYLTELLCSNLPPDVSLVEEKKKQIKKKTGQIVIISQNMQQTAKQCVMCVCMILANFNLLSITPQREKVTSPSIYV